MRRDDWLLSQLPVGMLQDDFFARYVGIFQNLATTIVDGVDNISNICDVTVAPEAMVRWLGSWIGVESIDPSLPSELQRWIVHVSSETLAWRGTRWGLQRFLELMSGAPANVEEGGGVWPEGGAPLSPKNWVRMRVNSTGWMPERDFVQLVLDEVPAHCAAELWVGERRVWPAEEVA